jgi:hypothetical protein
MLEKYQHFWILKRIFENQKKEKKTVTINWTFWSDQKNVLHQTNFYLKCVAFEISPILYRIFYIYLVDRDLKNRELVCNTRRMICVYKALAPISDDISVLLDDLDFIFAQTEKPLEKPNSSFIKFPILPSDFCMTLWFSVQFQTYTSTVVSIFLASASVPLTIWSSHT